MDISIKVKSDTGNYYNSEGCDLLIAKFDVNPNNFFLPRIGETLDIYEDNDEDLQNEKGMILKESHEYLVRDIHYWFVNDSNGINIYVIPVGRHV